MSFEIAEKILNAHRGAALFKADLHIHTPASHDWDEHNPEPEFSSARVTPEQIVQAALSVNIGLMAITDHNSVEWCEKVINAARGTNLVVLPGFELTARPGVHILAIFPHDKSISDIRTLLIKLGISDGQFGEVSAMTEDTVENISSDFKVIRMIQDAGGLAIPAHVDLDSGIVGRLKGGSAVQEFFEKSGCDIMEVRHELPPLVLNLLRNSVSRYATITSSDSHRIDEIGQRAIWVKMDVPSLRGLAQMAFEPLNRIQKTQPATAPKAQVIGIYSNGGHLSEQVYAFNEDLNCIIGGRGAGKSAIIDYVRFVLGQEPLDDDLQRKFRKRLVDLVRDSTTVYVLVSAASGDLWLYERTLTYTASKRGNVTEYEITSPEATVHQIILDQKRAVKFEENKPLFRIEFYGQGEVQSITNTGEPSRQLRLVDNFVKNSITQREQMTAGLETDILGLETGIGNILSELDDLSGKIEKFDELCKRIKEIEDDLKDSQLQDHQVWEEANSWVGKAVSHLKRQIEKINALQVETLEERAFSIPCENGYQTVLAGLLAQIYSTMQGLHRAEANIKELAQTALLGLTPPLTQWGKEYQAELDRYTSILRKQGVENLAALNRELAEKRAQCDEIKKQLMPRRDSLSQHLLEISKNREKKLGELYQCWKEMRDCKVQAAKRMTGLLGGGVIIRIIDGRNLGAYFRALKDFAPSSIYSRDAQLQRIVEALSPSELATVIRHKDSARLMATAGVTDSTALKMLQIEEARVLELERTRCDDIAIITQVIENKEKTLDSLSDGEKCTAVLSVVLLDETSPLVIDQPEDELDHAFIMTNVVSTLAKVKQKHDPLDGRFVPQTGRQFIIATHNQNVPVLGDAELVYKMRKVPGQNRCEYESAAGLEHPETIRHILGLEGGADAFERRRRKYRSRN